MAPVLTDCGRIPGCAAAMISISETTAGAMGRLWGEVVASAIVSSLVADGEGLVGPGIVDRPGDGWVGTVLAIVAERSVSVSGTISAGVGTDTGKASEVAAFEGVIAAISPGASGLSGRNCRATKPATRAVTVRAIPMAGTLKGATKESRRRSIRSLQRPTASAGVGWWIVAGALDESGTEACRTKSARVTS
jgi:hypothetical protein